MHKDIQGRLPMAAILRGLELERAAEVGRTLFEAGFEIIEVPLNSPDPYRSIKAIVAELGDKALVGAGTVLRTDQVDAVAAAGGRLIISPNCNPTVIAHTAALGMVSLPGVLTPTEMFAAIDAGATGLKIFPAELFSPTVLKAAKAVLPASVPVYIVGGINAGNMREYLLAGAAGFGLGGSLFKPGKPLAEISADAKSLIAAYRAAVSD